MGDDSTEDKMVSRRLDRLLGHAGIMLFVGAHFSKVAEKAYIIIANWPDVAQPSFELFVLYILGSVLFSTLYVSWAKIDS